MGETRRMHYVPQTYLKHFAREVIKDDKPEYFIHALNKENGSLKEINIKNICLETDMYKIESEYPEMRQIVETIYGKAFEAKYDVLYNLLTDDYKIQITPEQRLTAILFVVSMYYRNNFWLNGQNHLWDETLEKMYYLCKASGQNSYTSGGQEISIAGKTLGDLKKESRIENRSMNALISIEAIFNLAMIRFKKDVICVTKISDPFEFLTSDNPVNAKGVTSGHVIPIDPTNTFSIPINSQYQLQLRPWSDDLDQNMIGRMFESNMMAGVVSSTNNVYQAAQSSRFLLGSKAALEEYQKKPKGILPAEITGKMTDKEWQRYQLLIVGKRQFEKDQFLGKDSPQNQNDDGRE